MLTRGALQDKEAEPEFFRALLEARVYAHVPRRDHSQRLRLVQLTRPDGLTVLPFFSDLAQAQAATGTTTRVVAFTGHQLFESTRGATLMLNPNGFNCTLYPEEIAALLDRGEVAVVAHKEVSGEQLSVGALARPADWLVAPLIDLLAQLPFVEMAYLAELRMAHEPDQAGLLVALAVPSEHAERAARAITTAISRKRPRPCSSMVRAADLYPVRQISG